MRLRTPFDSTFVSFVTLALFVSNSVLNACGYRSRRRFPSCFTYLGLIAMPDGCSLAHKNDSLRVVDPPLSPRRVRGWCTVRAVARPPTSHQARDDARDDRDGNPE